MENIGNEVDPKKKKHFAEGLQYLCLDDIMKAKCCLFGRGTYSNITNGFVKMRWCVCWLVIQSRSQKVFIAINVGSFQPF